MLNWIVFQFGWKKVRRLAKEISIVRLFALKNLKKFGCDYFYLQKLSLKCHTIWGKYQIWMSLFTLRPFKLSKTI
jgi:hypothetical protein